MELLSDGVGAYKLGAYEFQIMIQCSLLHHSSAHRGREQSGAMTLVTANARRNDARHFNNRHHNARSNDDGVSDRATQLSLSTTTLQRVLPRRSTLQRY
eukprot:2504567-Rhodomonas_salina.1